MKNIGIIVAVFLNIMIFVAIQDQECSTKGVASWYGGGEKLNKYTASGEVFNPEEFTCAAWKYPFNAKLKITNTQNGKSVIVRVNDRGPKKTLRRDIDLTRRAFSEIADTREGLVAVNIEKLS